MSAKESDESPQESPKAPVPYRRDRTPSIVVQSLGLSFQKDITESIELQGGGDANDDDENSSPSTSEVSDPTSSGIDFDSGAQNTGGSAKGSNSSLQNQSSMSPTGLASPVRGPAAAKQATGAAAQQYPAAANTNRRLSLNIGGSATRRQSLTVDGLSSASFANPAAAYPSLKEQQGSGNATGSLRNKVALKPGHSLMGWIKLASTAKNLSGTNGKVIEVSRDELAKHDKETDCWVALKGNVYNVTTYLHYHPGGIEELMRGAGRDATELFNEVHRWVNYESILAKCLIGPYKFDSPLTPGGSTRGSFETISEQSSGGAPAAGRAPQQVASAGGKHKDPTVAQKPPRRQSIALTVPSPNKYQSLLLNNSSNLNLNQIQQSPTYVIMQDKCCIKLKVQDLTLQHPLRFRHLICDLNDKMELHLSVILSADWLYRVHLRLDQQVCESFQVDFSAATTTNDNNRTITVVLNKKEQAIWSKIGTSLDLNDSLCEMTLADKFFRPCQLISKQQLTHDTYLFKFKLQEHTLMFVPIGLHVLLREHLPSDQKQTNDYNDDDCRRIHKNYTPVLDSLQNDGQTDESGFMGHLCFIIKIYPDGLLTSKLNQLKLGDNMDISDYQCVDFDIESRARVGSIRHWILLAAGTGITPFCRIIPYLLAAKHGTSETQNNNVESVTLVFFNKTQGDIIWRDQFESLLGAETTSSESPTTTTSNNKFKFVNVLSNEPTGSKWSGKRGRISRELLAEFVDSKSPDELQLLCCGPRAFTQLTKSLVAELNLSEKLYIFNG